MGVMLRLKSDSWRGLCLLADAWDLHVCAAYVRDDLDILKQLIAEYENKGVWSNGQSNTHQ